MKSFKIPILFLLLSGLLFLAHCKKDKDDLQDPTPPPPIDAPKGVVKITYEDEELFVEPYEQKKLIAAFQLDDASISPGKPVWESSDPLVIKIDQEGNMETLKNGTATITVRSEFFPHISDALTIQVGHEYTSPRPYNVNIIYFVDEEGKDWEGKAGVLPQTNFRKRISETMLYLQDYYADWMEHWGYGRKTFGLKTTADGKYVKITYIKATRPRPANVLMRDNGGAREKALEIMRARGISLDSEVILFYDVVAGTTNYPIDSSTYTLLHIAYAIDNGPFVRPKNIYNPLLGLWDPVRNGQSLSIGATAHEMGHAFRLPHNMQKNSEFNQFGTSLMSSGNQDMGYGKKSFLTEFDASILNKSQTFTDPGKTHNGYSGQTPEPTYAKGTWDGTNFTVTIGYDNPQGVEAPFVMQDGKPNTGGYNSVPFKAVFDSKANAFVAVMPKSELRLTDIDGTPLFNSENELFVFTLEKNGKQTKYFKITNYNYADINSLNFQLNGQQLIKY